MNTCLLQIRSMANPLCVDTKLSKEHATFGLDLCLRDHRGKSGEQVMNSEAHMFYSSRWILECVLFRTSNFPGIKIFDLEVENCASMSPNETSARRLSSSVVTVRWLSHWSSLTFVDGSRHARQPAFCLQPTNKPDPPRCNTFMFGLRPGE